MCILELDQQVKDTPRKAKQWLGQIKKGAHAEKWKVVEQNEKSPKKHQKGPIVVNGKTTPKGKRPKKPIKSPTTQSQTREKEARQNSWGASVQTSTPVQLIVVSSPNQTNSGEQSVASPPRQSPAVVNTNSLAAVVKEMRDAALANNNIEPTIDEIEVEYQRRLALGVQKGYNFHHSPLGDITDHHPCIEFWGRFTTYATKW